MLGPSLRFAVLASAAALASAQTFGEISGTVIDPAGAAIPAAEVAVISNSGGAERRIATSSGGVYKAPFLPSGTYAVRVSAPRFKSAMRSGVEVQVDVVTRIDFRMEIGAVSESVQVTASTPLLSSENAAVGTVIENKRIVELPLNGRNWLQMVALSPNVAAEMRATGHVDSRQGGDRGRQPIAIAGQRQFFNHFTLDGVDNTDVNYNTYVIRPSIEALEEFKVQTGIYSAEYGRLASQINATTKAGGNNFHGAVFEFLRNDKLDAAEWQPRQETVGTITKNPFRRNQFGYALTGRLIRDKLFFMSNYEGLRDVKTFFGSANVAPAPWRKGDYSGQPVPIFDPATRRFETLPNGTQVLAANPFPGNIIPAARLHASAIKLLEFYPEATSVQPNDGFVQNYVRNRKRPLESNQLTNRIDFNESAKSAWFGRFSFADELERRIENFPQQEGGVVVDVFQVMVSNTRTLSPRVVNETRFGYSMFDSDLILHYAYERDVTKELGITGLVSPPDNAWGTPAMQLGAGLTGYGESGNGPWIYRNRMLQFLNNTSFVTGKHTLRGGIEARHDIYNAQGNTVARGRFYFNGLLSSAPGGRVSAPHLIAEMMLGYPQRSERALGVAEADLRALSWYGYFEDNWKITPRLSLNLGIRYEFTPPWDEPENRIMNIQMFGWEGARTPIMTRAGDGDFNQGLKFRFADAVPIQSGDDKLGGSLIHSDRNDFAPRIGLAWSPTDAWNIRAGGGVFYTQDQGNPRFDMARNLAGRGDFTASNQIPNSTLDDPWKSERQTFTCSNWTGNCVGQPFVLGNGVNRRTPYVVQWLFNVQRQVGQNLVLEAGYMGNIGRRLERLRSTNEPFTKTGPTDNRSIQSRRPFPVYGIIQQVENVVSSNYHALNLKVQHRFSRGLSILSGYTFGKAIDDASGIRSSSGEESIALSDWNLRRERGLSQFHTGHRWVNSVLYEIPWVTGTSHWTHYLFGDWQASGILTFSTGNPVRLSEIGDTNATGGNGNLPDATGLSPFTGAGTINNYWNLTAFDSRNPELTYRFGNVGRNVLSGPGYAQADVSMLKNISMPWEGHRLQFRWEAFNVTNHPNWNVPASDVRNANTFGRIQSARTMREMQFALKYLF
jgi:hypothetical protein